jgi:hypothetical protein
MFADLVVIAGDVSTPYEALIGATEEDVLLTVVDGDPLYGRPSFMEAIKPGDSELLVSSCGFRAALDVTDPVVPGGDQSFSSIHDLLEAAQIFDFQHMKDNFKDPAVAGMTDAQFQAYLDASFPLGIIPRPLDPYWVIEDEDYFDNLRNETNVTALDPAATLDIEPQWDSDADTILNACEPLLFRSIVPQSLEPHIENISGAYVDDLPGTLSDGASYYYRIDERGTPTATILLDKQLVGDTVRISFTQ